MQKIDELFLQPPLCYPGEAARLVSLRPQLQRVFASSCGAEWLARTKWCFSTRIKKHHTFLLKKSRTDSITRVKLWHWRMLKQLFSHPSSCLNLHSQSFPWTLYTCLSIPYPIFFCCRSHNCQNEKVSCTFYESTLLQINFKLFLLWRFAVIFHFKAKHAFLWTFSLSY